MLQVSVGDVGVLEVGAGGCRGVGGRCRREVGVGN